MGKLRTLNGGKESREAILREDRQTGALIWWEGVMWSRSHVAPENGTSLEKTGVGRKAQAASCIRARIQMGKREARRSAKRSRGEKTTY
eukprot:3204441-Pleurochrysis_carterae.AAC.2